MHKFLIAIAVVVFATSPLYAANEAGSSDKKVRVYLLAGQSNMEEKAGFRPLAWQIGSKKYQARYTHLVKNGDYAEFTKIHKASIAKDPDNPVYNFSERKDVWMSNHGKSANLSADYLQTKRMFGLEVNFGHEMGNKYDEQVLIIKTAWGGRSIHRGYRPPSAIPSDAELKTEWDAIVAERKAKQAKAIADYPKQVERYKTQLAEYEKAKKAGSKKKLRKPREPRDPSKQKPRGAQTFDEHKASYGSDYRNMIKEAKEALANIKTNFPGYKGQGYEIKGFVWFQGFNDMFAEEARNNYGKNLVKLIKDVKKDLNAPNMKVVIGQMGHSGDLKGLYQEKEDKKTGKMVMSGNGAIRKAQLEASQHADIKGFTTLVRTAPFWDMEAEAIYNGPGGWAKDINKWRQFGDDRAYHYYGSPWFFSQAGTGFAKAMIALESK
ncbi:MAG: hypothetical protein HN350_09485 [Phycisphaerales bacterium]|jgi:hypothetical protein|nr:hypothetical protein [Phycisphaerales bacterium]